MSYITLSKKAFDNNAKYYSDILGNTNKICIALKDNAYGHGIEQIASLSKQYGIKHCIVRDLNEANIILDYNFDTILVLYDTPKKQYNNIIFSVNSIEHLKSFPNNTKIELKLDTGMGRNGVQISQILKAISIIKEKKLILNGVFTHFHSADEQNNTINEQEDIFLNAIKQIKTKIKSHFRVHCSNTAAISKIKHENYDIARLGIGMYGYSKTCQKNLIPIMSLWANKISTRVLNINDTVGYGAKYIIKEDNTIVSNYDIGYGDGFFRINERKIAHIQNNKQIIGRVSMDSLSVLGNDEKICIFSNASNLAIIHDTIEYEILTHLMPHIKRVVI